MWSLNFSSVGDQKAAAINSVAVSKRPANEPPAGKDKRRQGVRLSPLSNDDQGCFTDS